MALWTEIVGLLLTGITTALVNRNNECCLLTRIMSVVVDRNNECCLAGIMTVAVNRNNECCCYPE